MVYSSMMNCDPDMEKIHCLLKQQNDNNMLSEKGLKKDRKRTIIISIILLIISIITLFIILFDFKINI